MLIDLNTERAPKSGYTPGAKDQEMIHFVLEKFRISNEIRNTNFEEFNGLTLTERQRKDQRAFNVWQEKRSGDDSWKSNAVRPIERNRIISIAAHLALTLIFPKVNAQNTRDEEDKDAALVMEDLMEWRADQADYEKTFLYSIVAALVNPAVIIQTEYADVKRKIKEIKDDGSWTEKEITDEIFSGFQDTLVPVDELYIANIYEVDIQKQEFLIWRKVIDYATAQAKYGAKENFEYVKPGAQNVLSGDNTYLQEDKDLEGRNVEEIIFYNRGLDLQVTILNGVLIDNAEQPNPRKDKMYPFAKTGFEIINEKFFYYKSLANKMSVDGEVVNTLYRMIIDGTFLQLMPPTAIFGDEEVNSNIIMPGVITSFGKDTKMEKIDVGGNLSAGLNVLAKVENSISETSQDVMQAGISSKGERTAFEISRLQENARTMLGLFGQMIGFLVKDLGKLFVDDIVQFMTVGEVGELTDGLGVLKFRKVLIPEQMVEGKEVTKVIDFDMELPEEITEEKNIEMGMDIMTEEGGMDSKKRIYKVNPSLFRELKYKIRISPEIMTPKNDAVAKAFNLELYDRAISNPLADQESIFRDLLLGSYDSTKHDTDKYIKGADSTGLDKLIGADIGPQTPMSRQSPVESVVNAQGQPT
jgi:hypothetical protein|tara:strand:+ start:2832 stop:4754 length:1923 start_codon:yes stop_codon:yes gene_type:complete